MSAGFEAYTRAREWVDRFVIGLTTGIRDPGVTLADADAQRPRCGAVCPSGPYAGVDCTKGPHGAEEEHEATVERHPGAVDVLEVWR